MKQVTTKAARRRSIADVKAHLSEILRELGPTGTIIHNRGRDVAVLLPVEDFELLSQSAPPTKGAQFLAKVADIKARLGGVDDFRPGRVRIRPQTPKFGQGF